MTLGRDLEAALARRFGLEVKGAERLAGGDINDAYAVRLGDGRSLFVKMNRDARPFLFEAEARGLAWLADAKAIRIPTVLGVGAAGEPPYLALELIRPAARRRGFDDELGRALAALHRAEPPRLGLDHDNFIGSLPQSNRSHERWADFFLFERLEPQLKLAVSSGRASAAMRRTRRR